MEIAEFCRNDHYIANDSRGIEPSWYRAYLGRASL